MFVTSSSHSQKSSCRSYMCLSTVDVLVPSISCTLVNMYSSSIPSAWSYTLRRFSVIFLGTCNTLVVPLTSSFRILSSFLCRSAHPHQPTHLYSGRASCRHTQHKWSDHRFVYLSLQCHWYLSVAQHSTASLPEELQLS